MVKVPITHYKPTSITPHLPNLVRNPKGPRMNFLDFGLVLVDASAGDQTGSVVWRYSLAVGYRCFTKLVSVYLNCGVVLLLVCPVVF